MAQCGKNNLSKFALINAKLLNVSEFHLKVLCFFGGYLIDRVLGMRFGAILFSCLITFGQILFGYGAYCNKTIMMDIGRFVFGLGGESVAVGKPISFHSFSFFYFKMNLI